MAATYAQETALRGQQWSIIVTIEGVGDSSGLWKFCSSAPAYGGSSYKPWLADLPQEISETIDPVAGGTIEAGELAIGILDYRDSLTSMLRLNASPASTLSANIDSSSSRIYIRDESPWSTNTVIWLGTEACLVTATGTGYLDVSRGYLDTDPVPHYINEPAYTACNFLLSRRMSVYVAPYNASTSSQETLITAVQISSYALDGEGIWRLSGPTLLRYLHRLVCSGSDLSVWSVSSASKNVFTVDSVFDNQAQFPVLFYRSHYWSATDSYLFIKIGDEIIALPPATTKSTIAFSYGLRGRAGSPIEEHSPDETVTLPLVSDNSDGIGSFRFSLESTLPTARNSQWTASEHAVDIMLCIMTSSAGADNYELNNRGTDGAWDCLPPGYGIGIPYDKIDVGSFLDVKRRFPTAVFGAFVLDPADRRTALEIFTESFLRPLGWQLVTKSGLITLVAPRLPVIDESATAWSATELLGEQSSSNRGITPIVGITRDVQVYSGVVFTYALPNGKKASRSYVATQYESLLGRSGAYAAATRWLQIELKSIRRNQPGLAGLLDYLAVRVLWKYSFPQWRISVATGWEQYALSPGDYVSLTLDELPDLKSGTRGWSSALCRITEKSVAWETATYRWELISPGPSTYRIGRVCPAADVDTYTSGNTFTASVNRYTSPAARGGLPTTDASAFTVGDVVRLIDRSGADQGGGTETVSTISDNDITLSSDFSGNLAAGLVVTYAGYDESTSTQQSTFVYLADKTNMTLGSSSDAPWVYGEP